MKQLQNNFTTPEQSKRLLEIGVPANSADCYLQRCENEDDGIVDYKPFIGKSPAIEGNLFSYRYGYTIPCWSVGRLIEILDLCLYYLVEYSGVYKKYIRLNGYLPFISFLVMAFEWNIRVLDFSKLEE